MEITECQYQRIADCLPRQRGNVSMTNLQVLNASLYVAEQGCKWRGLPKRLGNWYKIYTRKNRWSKRGVLDRLFTQLQQEQIERIRIEASTSATVHFDGTGTLRKGGTQSTGKSRGGGITKVHMGAVDARTAISFALLPGQAHNAPQGRALLNRFGAPTWPLNLVMDRAYEGDETRQLVLDLDFNPVVPPLQTRVDPWEYDHTSCTRRIEIELLFRRLRAVGRSFSRFARRDLMFIAFITFALVIEAVRSVNTRCWETGGDQFDGTRYTNNKERTCKWRITDWRKRSVRPLNRCYEGRTCGERDKAQVDIVFQGVEGTTMPSGHPSTYASCRIE